MLFLNEKAGPQMDANGNITNEYSYVVVNITVENKAEGPITDLLWGYLKLKTFETGDFISEVRRQMRNFL